MGSTSDYGNGRRGKKRHGDDEPNNGRSQHPASASLAAPGACQDRIDALLLNELHEAANIGNGQMRFGVASHGLENLLVQESFLLL